MMNDSKMINVEEEEEERVCDVDKISNEEHVVVANIGGDLDQKLSLNDQNDQKKKKSKYDEEDDEGIYVHPHR